VAIASLGALVAGVAAQAAGQRLQPEDVVRGAAILALGIVAATISAGTIERRSISAYGVTFQGSFRALAVGAVAACVLLLAFVSILSARHVFIMQGRLLDSDAALRSGAILLATCALRAFAIEAVVHGYALSVAVRALGARAALVLTGIAFGLGAVVSPEVTPTAVVVLCMTGFCLGVVAYATGSIWYGVGFLTSWTWVQGYLLGNPANDALANGRFINSVVVYGADGETGGKFGFEASAWMLILAGIAVIAALAAIARARRRATRDYAMNGPQPR
jgi:uncharacterized protein